MRVATSSSSQDFAPGLLKALVELEINVPQESYVADRVFELLRVERARAPVHGLIGLVVIALQDLLDQRPVGNGFAVAERHRRHLAVEQRAGDDARFLMHDLDILAGGVKDLEHRLVRHQRVKRRQIDAGKWIGYVFQPRRGHLDQAQLRPVGGLSHELRVDRHKGLAAKEVAGFLQILGGRYDRRQFGHLVFIAQLVGRRIEAPRVLDKDRRPCAGFCQDLTLFVTRGRT